MVRIHVSLSKELDMEYASVLRVDLTTLLSRQLLGWRKTGISESRKAYLLHWQRSGSDRSICKSVGFPQDTVTFQQSFHCGRCNTLLQTFYFCVLHASFPMSLICLPMPPVWRLSGQLDDCRWSVDEELLDCSCLHFQLAEIHGVECRPSVARSCCFGGSRKVFGPWDKCWITPWTGTSISAASSSAISYDF